MSITFFDHQIKAINELRSGAILCGGVGSGKSLTALGYFFIKECDGNMDTLIAKNPMNLFIITTARKRDTFEWEKECAHFIISSDPNVTRNGIQLTVDSWNNISKYINVKDSFFIFDEQRVKGSGTWVKSFKKIAKQNKWILLSATPGDSWMDYIPVFIANGYYNSKRDFELQHVVYNRYSKYPKIDHYINCGKLIKQRKEIVVQMPFTKNMNYHTKNIMVEYDKINYDFIVKKRWNPFTDKPIKNSSEYCSLLRRFSNIDSSRLEKLYYIIKEHKKVIVFYNFDYELNLIKDFLNKKNIRFTEWNGHKHEAIINSEYGEEQIDEWAYLVQYSAGAEGWNCIETNTILFYSQSYSFSATSQAAGRVDRLNSPYKDIFYYYLISDSKIDLAIQKCLNRKQDFNESLFDI